MCYLCIKVGAVNACAVAVAAFFYGMAIGIGAYVFQYEHVVKSGVESLQQNVCLPVPELCAPIDRTAETIGTFLLQVVGKLNLHSFAADGCYMKVLVISLWGAESRRVGEACLQLPAWFEE